MKIKFWGVRGSIATPGASTVIYGGNTTCVSVELDSGEFFIFDAGTGIRECGNYLLSKGGGFKGNIFISHTHWDHIQGFPFFVPSYIPGNEFKIFGPPSDVQNLSIKNIMEMQTNYEYFPIRVAQLGAKLVYEDCQEGVLVEEDNYQIHTCKLNHPVNCFGYKVIAGGKTYVYGGDTEPFRNIYRDDPNCELDEDFLEELDRNTEEQNAKIIEFIKDADLVSWDAQYTEAEYLKDKIGWGHSTYECDLELARQAKVKHLALTHHDPVANDGELQKRETQHQQVAEKFGFKLDFAKEGMEISI